MQKKYLVLAIVVVLIIVGLFLVKDEKGNTSNKESGGTPSVNLNLYANPDEAGQENSNGKNFSITDPSEDSEWRRGQREFVTVDMKGITDNGQDRVMVATLNCEDSGSLKLMQSNIDLINSKIETFDLAIPTDAPSGDRCSLMVGYSILEQDGNITIHRADSSVFKVI